MRISYINHVDGGSVATNTVIPGYPASNMQDQRLMERWISDTTTVQTATVTLATSSNSVDVAAIIGHTITTAATVIIQANSANTWTSPLFSTSLTVLGADRMIIKYFSATKNYKYWRYVLSGQASIEIGRLWLGPYQQIDPESTNAFTVIDKRTDNVIYGKNRQKFATEGYRWREINLSFPVSRVTAVGVIRTIHSTVGNHSSFIFCNFDDIRTYPIVDPVYCSIQGDISYQHTTGQKYTYSIKLGEDL